MKNSFEPLYRLAETNFRALELISSYLNNRPRAVSGEDIEALRENGAISTEAAYTALVGATCGLNGDIHPEDRVLETYYFPGAIHCMDDSGCCSDPYYRNIRMPEVSRGRWRFGFKTLQAYECFPTDDIRIMPDGREIPQAGFFTHSFQAPAVYQDGREWMTVTPSERNTMLAHVREAYGDTVVFGLGLGYYPYMISLNDKVGAITVVERSSEVISLFREYLLPQFPKPENIRIVQEDAFDYARNMPFYDCAYVDLWHDVSDGAAMYIAMKQLEKSHGRTHFMYWIESSVLAFIRSLLIYDHQNGNELPSWVKEPRNADELRVALSNEHLRERAAELPMKLVCH